MLPANVGTGIVTWQVGVAVIDGSDANQYPDMIPASGTVTFTPSITHVQNVNALPGPVTISLAQIVGVLDEDGYLCTPVSATDRTPMYRGVRLIATDDPDLSVQNWHYTVAYRLSATNGVTPVIPAHPLAVPEGEDVDLSRFAPVPSSPAVGTPQALALLAKAEEAATLSAAAAQEVVARANAGDFKGDPGLDGSNVLPADEGIAQAIATPASATATALSNTISESIEGSVGTRPEKYGAVGDGVHDDADAIQAWLDAGGTVMGSGNYAISKQLNITLSGVSYDLSSATITPLTADITMIRISGADVSIKANLDGLGIARIGIYASGDRPRIHDSKIRNFYSPTQTVRGIEVRTYGEPFIVHNNDIRLIGSQLNGGDEFNARAILINAAASTTDYGYITQNTIEDVYGGGAAHIHVIGAVALPNFEKVLTMIEGNSLTNTTRRFIKVQANGVTATGNTLTQQSTYARELRPAANIDIITSSDIVISRNIITENPLLANISCSGTEGVPCINVVIEGNTAKRNASSGSVMISLNRTYGFSVSGNTQLGGGVSLSCGNSKNGVVHSNTLMSDTPGTLAFNCNTLNAGVVMHSNQVFADRSTPFINSGPGAQSFNNTTVVPS